MTTNSPNDPRRYNVLPAELEAIVRQRLTAEVFKPFDDRAPPVFDRSVETMFLRLTIARAMTPKAEKRVHGLRQMERLLARQEAGYALGMEGHLLGSIARAYPVSHSAIRRELRGLRATGLVEISEQIELGFWVAPYRGHVPKPGQSRGPEMPSDER